MGNCKSCFKPRTSDDLDRRPTSRQSQRQQGQAISKAQEELDSNGQKTLEGGLPRASVRSNSSRASSGKSRQSISRANQSSALDQDVEEPSDFKRSVSARSNSKKRDLSSAGSIRNKENLPKVINVRPATADVYADGGNRLMITVKHKYKVNTNDYSDICSCMWKEDDGRLTQNQHYKFSRNQGLRCYLKEDFFDEHPTYSNFRELLKMYQNHYNSNQKESIQNQFLNEAMKKKVMQICWAYLVTSGRCHLDRNDFHAKLRSIWFPEAFRHIFAGETTGDEVAGLHNWLQYWLEYEKGNIVYNVCKKQVPGVMTVINYKWNGDTKPCGSMFVGTSPEFELALYTLLYFEAIKSNQREFTQDFDLSLGSSNFENNVRVRVVIHNNSLKTAYPKRISSNSQGS